MGNEKGIKAVVLISEDRLSLCCTDKQYSNLNGLTQEKLFLMFLIYAMPTLSMMMETATTTASLPAPKASSILAAAGRGSTRGTHTYHYMLQPRNDTGNRMPHPRSHSTHSSLAFHSPRTGGPHTVANTGSSNHGGQNRT